jgi:hypothetical protein
MPTPGIVFVKTSSVEIVKSDNTVNIFVPNTLAGNCLTLCFQSGTAPTADPTATDNIGTGTWAVAKGVVGNQRLTGLVQTNCPAGVNKITLTLQTTETFLGYIYAELYNVSQAVLATALDGTPSGATLVAGGTVAAGSLTTGSADSIVLQFGVSAGVLSDNVYTKGSGFTSLGKQRSSQFGAAPTMFLQYQVKTSPGAINPTYTLTGTTPTSDTFAFALKSAAAGSTKTGMYTRGALGANVVTNHTSITLDFPHVGNLLHIWAEGSDFAVSSITDGDGNSYVGENNSIPGLAVGNSSWRAINVNPNSDLATITITWAGLNVQPGFVEILDVVGADPVQGTNNRVQTVAFSGSQTSPGNIDFATITPISSDGMIFCNFQIETHTVSSMTSPSAAIGGCANIAVLPSADGAGTTMEEDNLHSFWDYTGTPGLTTFTATIQNNTAGVNHWGACLTEYRSASAIPLPAVPTPTARFLYVMP